MKNIQTIFKNNFLEAFSFKRYKIFKWWFAIIVGLIMSPFIIGTIFLGILNQIYIFFCKILESPSKYIKETIDENKIHPAPLFVVYLIAYPTKFFIDLLIALSMISMSIIYFFFVSYAYVMSLGGIKYQPYFFEADGNVSKEAPTYRMPTIAQIITALSLFVFIFSFIIVPTIVNNVRENNARHNFVAERFTTHLIKNDINNDYEIIDAYYFKEDTYLDYAIVSFRIAGVDKFVYLSNDSVYGLQINLLIYNSYFSETNNSSVYKLNTNKLAKLVREELENRFNTYTYASLSLNF